MIKKILMPIEGPLWAKIAVWPVFGVFFYLASYYHF